MSLAAGSWPWLLRHELRLAWRDAGGARLAFLIGIGGLLWLAYHAAVWSLLRFIVDPTAMQPATFILVGAILWLIFTLMLSQSITLSVGVFFDRGDLDLLLASPLRPRNVFIVRGLGVAVASVVVYAALLAPVAHVGALTGKPGLLAIYPALAGMALLAASLGMASTIALVRLLGARRARVAAQLLGAFVGAALFLALQLNSVVSPERSARWLALWRAAVLESGPLGPHSPLWLPLQAMLGDPLSLVVLATAGAGSFVFVTAAMARRFLAGTQESMTTPTPAAPSLAPARFRGGLWRIVLVKEWKLIGRDPQLIANTLLQTLYLLPLILVWVRGASAERLLVPAVVMGATTLASSLAWLTVAAEDAPELLASAPVAHGLLRRAKLVAALLPVWLLVSPLAIWLAFSRPYAAAIFAGCVGAGTLVTASIHLALPRPGHRRDMRRRNKANIVGTLLETSTAIAWTALSACLLAAPTFAWLAALPALGTPAVAWWLGRARRRDFGGI